VRPAPRFEPGDAARHSSTNVGTAGRSADHLDVTAEQLVALVTAVAAITRATPAILREVRGQPPGQAPDAPEHPDGLHPGL
jgi:plasmid maintenance system antidote protein VapI